MFVIGRNHTEAFAHGARHGKDNRPAEAHRQRHLVLSRAKQGKAREGPAREDRRLGGQLVNSTKARPPPVT